MPNTSKSTSEKTTENKTNEPNQPIDLNTENTNISNNSNQTSSQPQIAADLPVLAKDSYYLSRLERELARVAVAKNKQTNKDADNAINNKQVKAEKELAKKRAQYD